jgi:hypothetical protein
MDFRNYQDNEFEHFIQDEVNQHRMYPSDKVWKHIRTELHGYPAWPALTFISLLIITTLTVSTLLMAPSASKQLHAEQLIAEVKRSAVNAHAAHSKVVKDADDEPYFGNIEPQHFTDATISNIAENRIINEFNSQEHNRADAEFIGGNTITAERKERLTLRNKTLLNSNTEVVQAAVVGLEPLNLAPIPVKEKAPAAVEKPNLLKTIPTGTQPIVIEDSYLKNIVGKKHIMPWNKLSKVGFQFYITPSRSYRTLSDAEVKEIIQPNTTAQNSGNQNVPMGLNYSATVNDVVRHRPSTGLELGIAGLYNISSRLQLKTGLQLNIRQYHIETFKTSTRDLSTISLINNSGIQTINLFSSYNNNTGYKSEQLNNTIFQVAIPVGFQWLILKGNTLGLSAEASVQPTYIINNSSYLISTDYKNYTDGNSLMRRWNINTSAGFNISYKSGNNIWQIGPQIRYQHLPSYSNQYPIKEHLMDYGIRLGITRQWK